VSAFGEEAARWDAIATRMETDLAITVCREQVEAFGTVEHILTPKRSGALADSEYADSISGGGTHAVGVYGPHKIYAAFRNDGGTISAKDEPARSGKVHEVSGIPYRHSLAWGGGFAMHVTQAGSHYVERSEAAARGSLAGIAEFVLGEIFG
jgi:hypothetical protein